jgi:plasmid stabilization system protein ParE
MEVRVLWTDSALFQLEDIYDYYKIKANPRIAKKLVKTFVEETIILESNPLIGVKEPQIKVMPRA